LFQTVRLENPPHFGNFTGRNFTANYRRYAAEFIVEGEMHGARRPGAGRERAAGAAPNPPRAGRAAMPAQQAPAAARRRAVD
jgi:hypothetical protein